MTKPSQHLIRCPECGRENYAYADVCWICRRELNPAKPPVAMPQGQSGVNPWKIVGIVLGSIAAAVALVFAAFVALFVLCIAVISGAGVN